MVTWMQAYDRGAREDADGIVVPEGPLGDALERELVVAVRSRGPGRTAGCSRRLARGAGRCDICVDPLPDDRGGMCPLCVAARRKAVGL